MVCGTQTSAYLLLHGLKIIEYCFAVKNYILAISYNVFCRTSSYCGVQKILIKEKRCFEGHQIFGCPVIENTTILKDFATTAFGYTHIYCRYILFTRWNPISQTFPNGTSRSITGPLNKFSSNLT